jgi:hypothetical protein
LLLSSGRVTLDAQGDPNAVFIFQIGSKLTTGSNTAVQLINGAQACNVFWQVGSSATLGTGTRFVGTIMAWASITATTGATIHGRLLAQTAAVTLDTNTITTSNCASSAGGTGGGTETTTPAEATTLAEANTHAEAAAGKGAGGSGGKVGTTRYHQSARGQPGSTCIAAPRAATVARGEQANGARLRGRSSRTSEPHSPAE